MDNTALFDSEKYSDLKIRLSSGKLISVHKIVVCRNIEYFDSLCGPDSHFAVRKCRSRLPRVFAHIADGLIIAQEKKQDIIELKDDSPVALEGLLRWVYGLPALEGETDTCANWIDMRVVADKYLATALSEQSFDRSWEHVRQIQTAEGILEVNEKIAADASHDTKLASASERLRGVWLHQIVQVPRFREELSDGPERMLAMIDQLSQGGNLSSMNRKLLLFLNLVSSPLASFD
jgi:hypothetical protein